MGPQRGLRYTYLRLETHVKHSIRFVQNEVRNSFQVRDAPRVCGKEVNHPTRRADHNFCAFLHLSNLVFDRRTSIGTHSLQH